METQIQYENSTDRQTIIDNNKDKFLIADHQLFEGNFLIFSDTKPVEIRLNEIKNNTDMLILKQEGIV